MLLQFAVTNYRSFRETTVLSLVPAPGVVHKPGQTTRTGIPHCPDVLRAAVVYGPNGAGKSNLIRAIDTLATLVRFGGWNDRTAFEDADIRPFRLTDGDGLTTFEVEFVVNERHYAYGLVVGHRSVDEEWLTEIQAGGERPLFHRKAGQDWWATIAVLPDIAPAVHALARNVPPGRVFLHVCGEAGLGELEKAQLWFWRKLSPAGAYTAGAFSGWWHEAVLRYPDDRAHAESLLRAAGVGAAEIWFVVDRVDDDDARERMAALGITPGVPVPAARYIDIAPGVFDVSLRLVRRGSAGQSLAFSLDEESDGTARLLELAAWHRSVTTWDGSVGVVDEIERSLHPLVVRGLFEPLVTSAGGGQLLCTTHDSNLLDRTLLPADSIWFAQKGPDGSTKLYSLAEFVPDQLAALGDHLEQGYLNGRFGAIPFLGDAGRLGWKVA